MTKPTFAEVLKFNQNHDKFGKFTSASDSGSGGGPTRSAAHEAYLKKYPQYQPEVDAFVAKYPRKAQMDLEVRGMPDGIPSSEFQLQVEIAGHKRVMKEHRQAKAAERQAKAPAILDQLKTKYGLVVGDTVHDREFGGTKGVVRMGKDGQPYVETALGKHLVGARWVKAK
jgi:hypothetical protein